MKELYVSTKFGPASLALIAQCDAIVTDLSAQGYRLTIRQLYYQLVAKAIIPNTVQSYNNIQNLMNKARVAGMIDWDAIEDRTRGFIDLPHWTSGKSILESCAYSYAQDMWKEQFHRVFVIVEKEALAGVLEKVCAKWDMPLLAARGYPSASTLREFAQRRIMPSEQQIVILHLGDHDPSGMDMSRDLIDRLAMFSRRQPVDFQRIALNMDQINELSPPANPAKTTDCRYENYRAQFGEESWELDALPPSYINNLVETHVKNYIDPEAWNATQEEIDSVRRKLRKLAKEFTPE